MTLSIRTMTIILVVILVAGCFTNKETQPLSTGDYYYDVIYKTTSSGDLKLDIFMPTVVLYDKAPTVIYIHGGGWIGGSKKKAQEDFKLSLVEALREEGYTVVSIDYRLCDGSTIFPAPITDCKDAVRWIRKNSETYNIDPENIGVWGSSAGGHLASMVALTEDDDYTGGSVLTAYSSEVVFGVDDFGPADLEVLYALDVADNAAELEFETGDQYNKARSRISDIFAIDIEDIDNFDELRSLSVTHSPVTHADAEDPPMLILHGVADVIVPVEQSRILHEHLVDIGVENDYIEFDGEAGHGFKDMTVSQYNEMHSETLNFIKQNTTPH